MTEELKKILKEVKVRVVKDMPDYSNCPTVKRRAKEARAFLKKHPLPKWFLKK